MSTERINQGQLEGHLDYLINTAGNILDRAVESETTEGSLSGPRTVTELRLIIKLAKEAAYALEQELGFLVRSAMSRG